MTGAGISFNEGRTRDYGRTNSEVFRGSVTLLARSLGSAAPGKRAQDPAPTNPHIACKIPHPGSLDPQYTFISNTSPSGGLPAAHIHPEFRGMKAAMPRHTKNSTPPKNRAKGSQSNSSVHDLCKNGLFDALRGWFSACAAIHGRTGFSRSRRWRGAVEFMT